METSNVWTLVEILVLRIPAIFMLECIMSNNFNLLLNDDNKYEGAGNMASFCFFCSMAIHITVVMLLSKRQLVSIYTFLLAFVPVLISYRFNVSYIENHLNSEIEISESPDTIPAYASFWIFCETSTRIIIIQILLAYIFNNLKDYYIVKPVLEGSNRRTTYIDETLQFSSQTYMCFFLPVISVAMSTLSCTKLCLSLSPACSVVLLVVLDYRIILDGLPHCLDFFEESYIQTRSKFCDCTTKFEELKAFIESYVGDEDVSNLNFRDEIKYYWQAYQHMMIDVHNNGISVEFLKVCYNLLRAPNIFFCLYFLSTAIYHFAYFTVLCVINGTIISSDILVSMTQDVLIHSTSSFFWILCLTCIISTVMYYICKLFAAFLNFPNTIFNDLVFEFLLVSLHTGLTGRLPSERPNLLYSNVCLLLLLMLEKVLNMVNASINILCTQQDVSTGKHVRPVVVGAFLVAFPCYFIWNLRNNTASNILLFAITLIGVRLVFRVLTLFLLYAMIKLNPSATDSVWEEMGNYIYYLKLVRYAVDCIFSSLLMFIAVWNWVFNVGGVISAFHLLNASIYAYIFTWNDWKAVWRMFREYRSFISMFDRQLSSATSEEIESHADVCPICYLNMKRARVTRCHHMFHEKCIRTWITTQNRADCPVCRQSIGWN